MSNKFISAQPLWQNKGLAVLRIVTGLLMAYHGWEIFDRSIMAGYLERDDMKFLPFPEFMIYLGKSLELVSGILFVLGLFTRFACLIQIPILLGAVIFVNSNRDLLRPYSALVVSIVVLLLLIYFLIVGNGPLSFKIPEEEKKRSERFGP